MIPISELNFLSARNTGGGRFQHPPGRFEGDGGPIYMAEGLHSAQPGGPHANCVAILGLLASDRR
jgi:hypothetical protein